MTLANREDVPLLVVSPLFRLHMSTNNHRRVSVDLPHRTRQVDVALLVTASAVSSRFDDPFPKSNPRLGTLVDARA